MSFYKIENDQLHEAPNGVMSCDYNLTVEDKDEYTYPVDGWFWFDTKEEAYASFGLEIPEEVGFMIPTRVMPVF